MLPRATRPGPRVVTASTSLPTTRYAPVLGLRETRNEFSLDIVACGPLSRTTRPGPRVAAASISLPTTRLGLPDLACVGNEVVPLATRGGKGDPLLTLDLRAVGREAGLRCCYARSNERRRLVGNEIEAVATRGPGRVVLGSTPQRATTKENSFAAGRATTYKNSLRKKEQIPYGRQLVERENLVRQRFGVSH